MTTDTSMKFDITTFSSENEPVQQGVLLAQKHRLYSNPSWMMNYYYRQEYTQIKKLCIATVDGVPIGASLLLKDGSVMVFTRKRYRGNGIGRSLVNTIKEEGCYGYKDSPNKGKIFEHNGVKTY